MSRFGLEAIFFQTDNSLGMDIESAIDDIKGAGNSPTSSLLNRSNLSKAVSKSTGLKTTFELFADEGRQIYNNAAVLVPDVDRNNAVLHRYRQEWATSKDGVSLLKKKPVAIGGIDLAKGKVTGAFTELSATIYVSINFLTKDSMVTTRELTAIILHEIGHYLTYLETLGRMARTNYVLFNASKELLETNDRERQYKILDVVEDTMNIKVRDRDMVLASKSAAAITTVLISEEVRAMRSELGYCLYDYRGFEQLADQYATRMGYGKDIVTGLDKIFRMYGSAAYYNRITFALVELLKVSGLIVLIGTFFIIPNPAIIIIALQILCTNPHLNEYDTPKRRFEVIRNELNKKLKMVTDKMDKIATLESIEVVDKILADMNDHYTFYQWVWKTVYPWGWGEVKSVELQKALEDLANNPLYAASAKLSVLV